MIARRLHQIGKALRLLPVAAFRRGLRHGVGAAIEHRRQIAALDLATVVDVGANVGQFSLLASALFPRARIIAFEPLAGPAARFARLFAGNPRVTLHRAALGPAAATAAMHVSRAADSSSLLPIGSLQAEIFPGTEEVGTEQVTVAPLDRFVAAADIAAPALLKIDVQGYELEVLRGAAPLLDRFAWVYVEASFQRLYKGQALAGEVADFLARHGFAEAGRYNLTRDGKGRDVQADFLFGRAGRANPAGSA
ncbi:MAG: FkbM family methyltransferase [Alphaproteobacteria bacterium]